MAVRVTTDSTVEAVTTREARDWLRIDTENEDPTLAALVKAARQYVEEFTGRALTTKTVTLTLDRFENEILLPFPPAIAITAITYVDENGATQTLAASVYQLDATAEPARLTRAYSQDWPSLRSQNAAVSIAYTAGYGANAASVPQGLKQAILFLVAHWYEHREAVQAGGALQTVPLAVESLLWSFRVPEVG
ncbi:MAG: phage head-tail connector protein [Kiritimatiellae bacterium]|nr:phage head-tail connector protein [Kiritimatiellia bacterium]